MRTLVVVVAVLGLGAGCKKQGDPPRARVGSGSAGATVARSGSGSGSGSGSAGSSAGSADPWAAPVYAADDMLPPDDVTHKLADQACPSVKAAFFFRIEKDGKTSYLLGTRHLGVDISKLPNLVTDRLAAAKLAVFETAPDDKSDEALPHPAHPPLPDAVGPDVWARYSKLVGKNVADELAGSDPATALLMMGALYEDKTVALDDELQQLATKAKIPIKGLETSAFQQKLIEHWLDLRALIATVKVTDGRDELKQQTLDDLGEYCAGTDTEPGPTAKERQDMIDGGYTDAEIAQYEEDLLFSRNRDWIPKLEKILAPGDVFVAVGADHLIGDKGVPALLTQRGYRVTRVTAP